MTPNQTTQKHIKRPPVICIMGHIDHGKSTLLDYIRKTNIVDEEAGGITQKISAYEVVHNNERITFLDTPGHESFGKIRERGAKAADIAVLVVSAEDGVKKQTLEAYRCIKSSQIPLVIAVNKIDKPNADIERTKISLAENEIYLEGFGGSVPFVPISAKTGQGVSELLDLLLLVAEMEGFEADPDANAEGVVIEANLDKQKGISATLIIKNGTLETGMFVVCDRAMAPTRIMEDFHGKKIKQASFSSPIRIIGFDSLPAVGSTFYSFPDRDTASAAVACHSEKEICPIMETQPETDESEEAGVGFLNIVIKADVIGSLEGIEHELDKIRSERLKIKIVSSGVGEITENDVRLLAGKPHSLIVGFNIKTDSHAKSLAEKNKIEIKTFDIIYKLAEWLETIAVASIPKVMVEQLTGRAKILKYFSSIKDKHIIGGRVEESEIEVGDEVKIMRHETEIGRGKIRELQQQKEKVSSVRSGVEFGCQLQSTIIPAAGDKLEAFKMVEK